MNPSRRQPLHDEHDNQQNQDTEEVAKPGDGFDHCAEPRFFSAVHHPVDCQACHYCGHPSLTCSDTDSTLRVETHLHEKRITTHMPRTERRTHVARIHLDRPVRLLPALARLQGRRAGAGRQYDGGPTALQLGGQLVLGNQVLLGYLLISAVCSTVAFALFEVSTIFQLHDLMALDVSIKAEIGAEKLIKRGYFVLAVSSLINFLSVLYFLALAWHTSSGTCDSSRSTICPSLGTGSTMRPRRGLYRRAVLGGHLRRAAQERQRGHSRHPAGAVAAALASPETAERIAVLEAATSGGLSALDAARLNVRRAGHDPGLLDGLEGMRGESDISGRSEGRDGEEPAAVASPLPQVPQLMPLAAANRARS